uniref:Maturase K n=1 Tax=Bursaphelenchus xylophilus TaxID=6326 RepID=A0A1I7SNH0_BURXY
VQILMLEIHNFDSEGHGGRKIP